MVIYRMGCNSHHGGDFNCIRHNGYPSYLFLLVKTPSIIRIDGVDINAAPYSFIVYTKNTPHYYRANSEEYIDDWVHFDVDNGKEFFAKHNIPLNTVVKLYDTAFVDDIMQKTSDEFYSGSPTSRVTSSMLFELMFTKLGEIVSRSQKPVRISSYYGALVALRGEIYSNPCLNWSVDTMANRFGICATYMQRLYKNTFGVSCAADVITARIDFAKELLDKTKLTVNSIAASCGYQNPEHFMRQFKALTSLTPTQYRKADGR